MSKVAQWDSNLTSSLPNRNTVSLSSKGTVLLEMAYGQQLLVGSPAISSHPIAWEARMKPF